MKPMYCKYCGKKLEYSDKLEDCCDDCEEEGE